MTAARPNQPKRSTSLFPARRPTMMLRTDITPSNTSQWLRKRAGHEQRDHVYHDSGQSTQLLRYGVFYTDIFFDHPPRISVALAMARGFCGGQRAGHFVFCLSSSALRSLCCNACSAGSSLVHRADSC
jgi:hypothetical protein